MLPRRGPRALPHRTCHSGAIHKAERPSRVLPLFIRLEVVKLRSLPEMCGLRVSVETHMAPKGPLQCKRCQRFGHTQRYCGYAPRCVAFGEDHHSGECCSYGGNHTAYYRGCVKWNEAKGPHTRTVLPSVLTAQLDRECVEHSVGLCSENFWTV